MSEGATKPTDRGAIPAHARLKARCLATTEGADPYRQNAEHLFDADQYDADVNGLVVSYTQLLAERDKLLAFKTYCHARLDQAGVSPDPDSPHKAEGCRVGGRLDELIGERDRLRKDYGFAVRIMELIRQYKDDPATLRVWCGNIGVPWLDALIAERDQLRQRVAELESALAPFAEEWRRVRAAFVANTGREPDAHAYRGFCLLHATAADLSRAAAVKRAEQAPAKAAEGGVA